MTIRKLAASPPRAAERDPHRGDAQRAFRGWVERILRTISYGACALVIIGFVAFAYDQVYVVSEHARQEISSSDRVDPTPAGEQVREHRHTAVRELIDDANDALLKPFAGVESDTQPWLNHLVPALLALLVYGFGLGYLASFARGRFPR